MYGTQKNQLKGLTKSQFLALKEMCKLTKNMYNVALYNIRQHFFREKQYLRYESNYHVCKTNENYSLLNTDIAQQTLKVADRSFHSFFSLIQKAKSGTYQFNKISIPHYLKKDGYFSIIIPRIKVKDGYFSVPMSSEFKKKYGKISIKFPSNLEGKIIKEVRIHPKYNAKYFEIEYIYLIETEDKKLLKSNVISIDLGLDNLATCVTNSGSSFIIDGKKLKSINRFYNKENARLQSIKDLQKIKGYTKKQSFLMSKRNRIINDYMNKTARYIINYCIKNNIGTLVIGYNIDFKRDINIGHVNNQNYVQIPHGNLRIKLKNLCERYNIAYFEQEESYTSKSDFLSNDILPVINVDNPVEYTFLGKRITRGQYKSSAGKIINADLNGALNIMRKSKLIDCKVLQNSGCLAQPLRIRIA